MEPTSNTPSTTNTNPTPSKNSKRGVLIGAIVVLVLLIIVAAWMLVKHHSDANSKAASQNSTMDQMPANASGNQSKASQSTGKTGASASEGGSATAANGQGQKAPTIVSAISIKGMAFSPASATVKKGAPLTWTNDDNITHTIAETDGQTGPHSPQLKPGDTYTYTFTKTGTYKYDCSIHPSMTGTITVVD